MSCKRLQVTVVLNVYDLHEYNGCLYYVGMGVYHCGVELQYDSTTIRQTKEYSYLGNPLTESTGVFNTHPRSTFGAKYRMSMDMGTVYISNQELALILDGLKIEYLAKDYNILTKYGVYTEMVCIMTHSSVHIHNFCEFPISLEYSEIAIISATIL